MWFSERVRARNKASSPPTEHRQERHGKGESARGARPGGGNWILEGGKDTGRRKGVPLRLDEGGGGASLLSGSIRI